VGVREGSGGSERRGRVGVREGSGGSERRGRVGHL
jgi:hypothetical protein